MYEEPYRWMEAVDNRRQYIDDQLAQGAPVIALSFAQGIVLLTMHRGTSKVYEIYDRIALGGMGHPADLEKIRFSLLDLAHVEGFQRSPSDVTAARLTKNGVAPLVKQAFEEIFRAPYIVKILLAEVAATPERDRIATTNYDGLFRESSDVGVLVARQAVERILHEACRAEPAPPTVSEAVRRALYLWGMASLLQGGSGDDTERDGGAPADSTSPDHRLPDAAAIRQRIHEALKTQTVECVLLDRTVKTMETYRVLEGPELQAWLPDDGAARG